MEKPLNTSLEVTPGEKGIVESNSKPVTTLITVISVLLILVFIIFKGFGQVGDFIRHSGWIGMLVSIGLYGVLGASPVPSEPVTVLITSAFGPLAATFIACAGNLLAALIEFYIGTKIGDVTNFDQKREKLPFGLGKVPVNSPAFLIVARMLPGYGPKFVSVISGVYHVPLWRYIWTATISTLIGAAIVAYGGFGLLNIRW